MGGQASVVCLCCSCWGVKWNSGSWVGLRPSLYLPPSDYFTPLIFSPLHWSEKITGNRENERKSRGREERATIDWPTTRMGWLTAPWVAELLPSLISDWDPAVFCMNADRERIWQQDKLCCVNIICCMQLLAWGTRINSDFTSASVLGCKVFLWYFWFV